MTMWNDFLFSISKRVNEQSFETWFRPMEFHSQGERTIHVRVPNEYFQKGLIDRYSQVIQDALTELKLADSELSFLIDDGSTKQAEPNQNERPKPETRSLPNNLISKYTFESFVIGSSNQFAHAASLAVAKQPAKAYNPLFVYGGVGLGKTHLMHAIGHFILSRNSFLRLSYVSSEDFTNDLINSIRYDHTCEFRDLYRNTDVLLMDDIQFLAGKERTQEEFFHTFNSLYNAQKQIVITSDCPPREIPTLEERLHSRFEWGLIADIQPPDLETKIAILKKKAAAEKLALPDDVAYYIATNIKSNIRELEGSLIRLIAYASLTGTNLDMALSHQVLSSLVNRQKRVITPETIIRTVAHHFRLNPSQLKSKNNSRSIAGPRQIAMYFCKELTKTSLPGIGKAFGGKHHTTVLHSIRKVASQRKKDTELDTVLKNIASHFE